MSEKWSVQKANDWYASLACIRGCNYLPRTAINSTEMWQSSTFDPTTIDQELGWAKAVGYNSVRVFLQFLVWESDPVGLKERMKQFLTIANQHQISTMFILFDDCAFANKEPYLGPQDDPLPGIHNSGWTPSPGLQRVTDRSVWQKLEEYVVDIISAFGNDQRVIVWDLYNEPGNSNLGDRSLQLVEATFEWARNANPQQPITTGVWRPAPEYDDAMSNRLFELSDIITFHCYRKEDVQQAVNRCAAFGRPIICTEWLHRRFGQMMETALPVFSRGKVGWYNWGFVAGRTQTYLDWRQEENKDAFTIWQHDILHADGTPYDDKEIIQIQTFRFE